MKKVIILLFSLLLLTGCTKTIINEYTFNGESENWEAEYSYKGTENWDEKDGRVIYSNTDGFDFVLKYKGSLEEFSSVRFLEYSYATMHSSGRTREVFSEAPSTVKFSISGNSKGSAKVNADEVIKVNVKWNDFEESFELYNNK